MISHYKKPIESETIAYINRVTADGGTVIDAFAVDFVYTHLKRLNLLSYCQLLVFGEGGLKKDGSNRVSKAYDLSSNAWDGVQTTGSLQLLWADFGNRKCFYNDNLGTNSGLSFPDAVGVFRNQARGALLTVKNRLTSDNYGATMPSVLTSATSTTRLSIGVASGQNTLNGRRLDGDSAVIINGSLGKDTPAVLLVVGEWANGKLYGYENGTSKGDANFAGSGNTSDTNSAAVGIIKTTTGTIYIQIPFFSLFNGLFDRAVLNQFGEIIRKYYGI